MNMIQAGPAILLFIIAAVAFGVWAFTTRTPWTQGELCDKDPWDDLPYERKLETSPAIAAPYGKSALKPFYIMLCMSVEGVCRAVDFQSKNLLAEITPDDWEDLALRGEFINSIAGGLINAYGYNVNPIVFATPIAHNIMSDVQGIHPCMWVHTETLMALMYRKPF